MNDVVHVAFLQDNLASDYNRHTGTAMLSMLECCSKHAIIHVFHEENLSLDNIPKREEEINKYRELVSKFDAEIHFHNVTFPEEFARAINPELHGWNIKWKRIIFTRYFIQDILPDVDRIIVLDSDTIVRTDVSKLLESLPNEYSFGAALADFKSKQDLNIVMKSSNHLRNSGLDVNKITIGGVQLFNLKKIRETGILPAKALEIYSTYPGKYSADDITLSTVFHDDIYFFDLRFNYCFSTRAKTLNEFNDYIQTFVNSPLKGYILHFAENKPWDSIDTFYDIEYWIEFYKTPWGREDRDYTGLKNTIGTFESFYSRLDDLLYRKRFHDKLRYVYGLTIPLWIKLIKKILK